MGDQMQMELDTEDRVTSMEERGQTQGTGQEEREVRSILL